MTDVSDAMTDSDKQRAVALSLARVAFGVTFVALPGVLKGWLGDDAKRPATRAVIRAFGVRDVAVGLAAYSAVSAGDAVGGQRMLQLGAACDTVDALATLVAFRHLPKAGALLTLATAAGAAATGFSLASRIRA
jgi:hypothetical protein